MPKIEIVDLKTEKMKSNKFLSQVIIARIKENLLNQKQVLLFLNRRGYAPVVLCKNCGHKIACPSCSCTLTKHKFRQKLVCHCCNYSIDVQ